MLAPNAKLRSLVVPQEPPAQAQAATEAAVAADCEVDPVQAPRRISWARLLKRVQPGLWLRFAPRSGAF